MAGVCRDETVMLYCFVRQKSPENVEFGMLLLFLISTLMFSFKFSFCI